MTKKLLFLFFLTSLIAQGQSIRLEGVVQDTLRKPLEMANVMAINQETKAMDSYGIKKSNILNRILLNRYIK